LDTTFALLRSDADLNAQDARGWTPLHWVVAAERCLIKTMAALVEFGANLRLRDEDGDTVRDLARSIPATGCDDELLRYLTPEVVGFSM
jgi:ankyrin repeat protein